ncbi:MAG: hypothetical protein AB7G28_21830 [Pirellulales bacterium]
MSALRCQIFSTAVATFLAALLSITGASAQDLASRPFDLRIRRSALMEHWDAQRQEQIDFARYRSPAQFGIYGARYGGQTSLGYHPIVRRPFDGVGPYPSNASIAAAATCISPLGYECSPLDCDCDPYGYCY